MFEGVRAVLFDLDGTVYYGGQIIDGANDAIEHCRRLNKRVFFLTNNSTKTRQQVFNKLRGMGISCRLEEIVTSGYMSALYLLHQGIDKLYVCGTDSLCEELRSLGVSMYPPDGAKNLLIGYDPEFDYERLTIAVRVAMHAENIIACNKERVFQGEGALLFPGCGAMVTPIEWCSGREVDFLVGKPNTLLLETLCCEFGYEPSEILMVGDTYESDVLMANRFGCSSVLVSNNQYSDTVSIRSIGELVHLFG